MDYPVRHARHAGRINASDKRPIDLEHLDRQTLHDPGIREEVLRVYDLRQSAYFSRLVESGTTAERQMNLSVLKGAALGVGALTVAEIALDIEMELAAGGTPADYRFGELGLAIKQTSQFIATLIAD